MKNLSHYTILFLLCFFIGHSAYTQNTNTDIVAKIKVQATDNVYQVIATSSNTTEVYYNLRYVLSVIRPDPDDSEKSLRNSKEDRFTLQPSEASTLAQASISIAREERVIVLLLVYDQDDKLVAKDRVVFNDTENGNPVVEKIELPNDGIELIGIVADETKTKIGKDFYDYFYYQYTFNNIKGKKIVSVEEIVSFRRNTFIQVKIDNTIVFEFYSKPNDEFLEQMSKSAIQRVYRHFENLKKENAYITQY